MTELQRRRVHVLAADAATATVLVGDGGALPSFDLEFVDSTTGLAVVPALRERGFPGPLLDCFIDQGDVPDGEPIGVVVEVTVPDALPGGLRFAPAAGVVPPAESSLRDYVTTRVAEWCGERSVPAERSAWTRPGWFERLRGWVDEQLVGIGEGPALEMLPFRMWGISAVFRVDTARGRWWCKAVYPHFAAEPRVTARLGQLAPGAVPTVVAVEPVEGWMLLEHLEGSGINEAGDPRRPIGALVDLQRRFADRVDELVALGVPDRRLGHLLDDLAAALAADDVRAELSPHADRLGTVVDELRPCVTRVQALGFPDTLVHGDFHPNNVTLHGERPVVFDWSDAALGCPLVDVGAWGAWLREDRPALDHLWRCVAEAWSPSVDSGAVLASRPWADAVVAAYHVLSYVDIARGLEPLRRDEAAIGIRNFFTDLVGALDAVAAAA